MEILEERMFSNYMEQSRDEECREKFEVGRECASWEVEGARKKICVACEAFAKVLVPDATVQFFNDGISSKRCCKHVPPTFSHRVSVA